MGDDDENTTMDKRLVIISTDADVILQNVLVQLLCSRSDQASEARNDVISTCHYYLYFGICYCVVITTRRQPTADVVASVMFTVTFRLRLQRWNTDQIDKKYYY